MIGERIKLLRQKNSLTQKDIADMLEISRTAVNSWEMDVSVPSAAYLIELSKKLGTSVDFLLGLDKTASINVSGLTPDEVATLVDVANRFRAAHGCNPDS